MFITCLYYSDGPRTGPKGMSSMTTQLHLALGIVDGRAHPDRDLALVRDVELARQDQRRARRHRRFFSR